MLPQRLLADEPESSAFAPPRTDAARWALVAALLREAWTIGVDDPKTGMMLCERALAEAGKDGAARARALAVRARTHLREGSVPAAVADGAEALRMAAEAGDAVCRAWALCGLGDAQLYAGDPVPGLRHLLEARRLLAESGDRAGEAYVLVRLASGAHNMSAYADALEYTEAGLAAARACGDLALEGDHMNAHGAVHGALGDLDQAFAYFSRSREIAERLGKRVPLAQAHHNLAVTHERRGEWNEALAQAAVALRLAREAAYPLVETYALLTMAESHRQRGDTAAALRLSREAVRLDRRVGLRYGEGGALLEMGRALAARGHLGRAATVLEAAVHVAEEIEAKDALGDAHRALADVYERTGALADALRHFRAHSALREEIFRGEGERRIRGTLIQAEARHAQREAEILQAKNAELRAAYARLEEQAAELDRQRREDPLTRLANRRQVDETLARELERARRHDHALAFAVVDIDHFKGVNDRFGHPIGDLVLRSLGRLLRDCVRSTDLVGRYGGEEFVALLTETDAAGAVTVCEKLRGVVEAHPWPSLHPGLAVTVSVGVATRAEAETADALFALADARLYAAKEGGRNRVRGPEMRDVLRLVEGEREDGRRVVGEERGDAETSPA